MEIKSLDGQITWVWDSDKKALITLLPNGEREQLCAGDVALMLKLLTTDKVKAGIKAEVATYGREEKILLGNIDFL